ncbi:pentapeptide repeat-containing protein (plasmid) [Streptomyces sp. JL4002]|uniref:pentapeptide repeat-containing protein n=1 Tax=Streptomyces sp. JL4002 TaxID=3404781 RepID=UPI003B28C9C1
MGGGRVLAAAVRGSWFILLDVMAAKKKFSWRGPLLGLGALIALVVYLLLLWKGPWWFDGAHLRTSNLQPADGVVITGFRTMLVALGVAVTAGIGLFYTHRNHQHALAQFEHTREKDREQAEMAREDQVTGRYVEAIKLLAVQDSKDKGVGLTERLGGIYALERIMRDSEKDHDTVVQVLAAFVRQHAPAPDPEVAENSGETDVPGTRDDVQAALTVLGRRPWRDESQAVDLSFTALWRADLVGARLAGANLIGAELQRADLTGADLKEARLAAATFTDAKMHRLDLRGADLVGEGFAAHLDVSQLLQTTFNQATKLPLNLSTDAEVKKALESPRPVLRK